MNFLKHFKPALLFLAFGFLVVISCNNNVRKAKKQRDPDFVYLEGKRFINKGNDFFPLIINYSIFLREIEGEYFVSPINTYGPTNDFEADSKDSCLNIISAHFQLIKEMGFNTLRIVGPGRFQYDDKKEELVFTVYSNATDTKHLPIKGHYDLFFDCIDELLDIAEENGLKILLLNPSLKIGTKQKKEYLKRLLKRFSDNNTIFAYDFFNEPLYFDRVKDREKKEAYEIVLNWREMMDQYAPNQLFTIGFSEPIEVFEWDPEILPVDFLAFHTYDIERVPNEIFWYTKYISKPWVIAETSIAADDDSVSYQKQKQFLIEAYQRTIDCGGSGFGWWQFQDVDWGRFKQDYKGLLTRSGITKTKDNKYTVLGSKKPAAEMIKNLKEIKKSNGCPCMNNYFNMLGYKKYVVTGKVINGKTNEPIEGAVIRGWSKNWSVGANTFTNHQGRFNLFSDIGFEHFRISAPAMTTIKFNYKGEYSRLQPKDLISTDFCNNKNDRKNDTEQSKQVKYALFEFDKKTYMNGDSILNIGKKKIYPVKFID